MTTPQFDVASRVPTNQVPLVHSLRETAALASPELMRISDSVCLVDSFRLALRVAYSRCDTYYQCLLRWCSSWVRVSSCVLTFRK
jgi:hypothetical protein